VKPLSPGGGFGAGAVLAILAGGLSLASLFWVPYGRNDMEAESRFLPPSGAHILGTDNFGRDVFSRVMEGGRYSLFTALVTAAGSAVLGSVLGLSSGYAGGPADEALMRLMDALSSFPGILLALVMVSLLGSGGGSLITALLVLFIPSFTRIMRSGMMQFKNRDFVKAARLWGASPGRLIFVHNLPNVLPSLLSASVLGLSNAILAEAAMSYLGLGIQPPLPSWGRMLSESQNYLFNAPWCALAPGLMIVLSVMAFHFLGEGIRRRFSPGA
jgi:peptide/nickel transport system permease protein